MSSLQKEVEAIYEGSREVSRSEFDPLFSEFLAALNSGQIRAAEPAGDTWKANSWVKKGILLGFRFGVLKDYSLDHSFPFFDKDTYPLRPFRLQDNVRLVPGGTSVRSGCYLAPGVVVMPPAYINVGAYVGEGTLVDSHALVGSCAQIGARVHLSAGAQIGGVLEPVGALPVVVEDEVLVGGNTGIYEGTVVKRRAVIGAGTILTASIPVYDLVRECVHRGSRQQPLVIPENAVVVPGGRAMDSSEFARSHGLHLSCALIVKYRDEKTDAATVLEAALR